MLAVPGLRWRAGLVTAKLRGQLPAVDWGELLPWLRPRSPVYLEPLWEDPNPFVSIVDPLTSPEDAARGDSLVEHTCARCHGAGGRGAAGPALVGRPFAHGGSDWALYRNITHGIPGTGMPRNDLPSDDVWRIIAYLRARRVVVAALQPPESTAVAWHTLTTAQIERARRDSGEWTTYSGALDGWRFSRLAQIRRDNVSGLALEWAFQLPIPPATVEATPIVVGQTMFVTSPPGSVWALDVRTGLPVWSYERKPTATLALCCGEQNRGVAVLGDRVYVGTLDAHLIALDARTGHQLWDVTVADASQGYSITSAPLAVNGKILIGVSGGEYGIRGFLDAYDQRTGARLWRFVTIPGPGEPGNETWGGTSWRTGGGPTWVPGAYDPGLRLLYWGVGNPSPDYEGDDRPGDNLYTSSVVALDPANGALRWYFQFTPHDLHDFDANQIPILVDTLWRGAPRHLMYWANRNGFLYVLDRATGNFLAAHPFAHQSWALGLDSAGRPTPNPKAVPSPEGTRTSPSNAGATNWWSPAYSPRTGLVYIPTLEKPSIYYAHREDYHPGRDYIGSEADDIPDVNLYTAIRAWDPLTGTQRWEHRFPARTNWAVMGGLLATAGDLVFGGDSARVFALDARTGTALWQRNVGGTVSAGAVTYLNDGRQYVTVAAGRDILTFALPVRPRP